MARRWLISGILILSIGCSSDPKVEPESVAPQPASRDFTRLTAVLAGLQRPADIQLCEGLPGEFWEPELREQERSRKETFRLHGYTFYKELLTLSPKDTEELAILLSSKKSFKAYHDNKHCGAYQPDYGITWKRGDATTDVLISLECGEVKIYGPRSELHCGLGQEAGQKLGTLLSRYRKNRPTEAPNG